MTVALTGCLVSQGGASEENSGGAAEQQPVHGDPQREHRVCDGAGGERTGAEGARYESLSVLRSQSLVAWLCVSSQGSAALQ